MKTATAVTTVADRLALSVRQHLREAKVEAAIKAKAYWAEGRTGLD